MTADVPRGFEYAKPEEALLWGEWLREMDGKARPGCEYFPPTMESVEQIFNIGRMFRTFCVRERSIDSRVTPVCYRLYGKDCMRQVGNDPSTALPDYMQGMITDGRVWPGSPRVMTIDVALVESLPMEELLDPEKIGAKWCIQMDPPPLFKRNMTG